MNSLLIQNVRAKIVPVSISKCISSFSITQSPSFVEGNRYEQQDPAPFLEPIHFFSNYLKFRQPTVKDIKIVHAHFLKLAFFNSDTVIANSLLRWYFESGAVFYALKLFEKIPQLNVISWNVLISGYYHNMLFMDSWRSFCRMHCSGFKPNDVTYCRVLSACVALEAPNFGQPVYVLAIKQGYFSNSYIRARMIDLFVKNSSFEHALMVFYDALCDNVVCWNSIISGAVRNEEHRVALDIFCQMCRRFLLPNSFTLSSVLTACAMLEDPEMGKTVQGWVIKCCEKDVFVATAIVDMYSKCGEIREAAKEFSRMPVRNVVSWTAIISGFVKGDDSISALKFFKEMRKMEVEVNNFTITTVISACAKPNMIKEALQIHNWILKNGFYSVPVVGAALINMYAKAHAIDLSEMVFRETGDLKNPSAWTTMISSLAHNQSSQRAIDLFLGMLREGLRPDKFCVASVFAVIDCLNLGRQVHCYTLKTGFVLDLSVGSSLFTMYSKCGSIEESYEVYERIPVRDNISWASMISGFTEHGYGDKAFELFREMLFEGTRPDQVILSATLSACSGLHYVQKGKEIHGYAFRHGMGTEALISGALVNMYSKCGILKSASKVFDMLPEIDQVACSSLISGYTQNGLLEEAIFLFRQMLMSNFSIDSFSLSSVLGAVALLNRLEIGIQLHAHITKLGLDSDVYIGSALVTMYSKCGNIEDCHKVFIQIREPDLISCTAMIAGYAQHGRGAEALGIYEQMRKQGIKPDSVTFVGILSACSHANLVEEGYFHFNSMREVFGIEPSNRHYACMVDLLGRSGKLKEAEEFIRNMPIEPDGLVWTALLSACKLHGDVELGKKAAKKVMELNPNDDGAYVSLSNICADVGQWEEVLQIRSLMTGSGVRKEAAWSSM